MMHCHACPARHHGICGGLDDARLAEMTARITHRRIEAGRTLLADGEAPQVYANLISGVVKLSKTLGDGRRQIVGLQFPPECVGRPFASQAHASAEAVTEVVLCSVPRSLFEAMMKRYPELERELFRQTLQQLDEARDWLVALGRKRARERVAELLYVIARHLHAEPSTGAAGPATCIFDLPLSRDEMADFLGLTIETVSRQITRLRQDGIIAIADNRRVTVPDMDRLLAAAEG